MYIHPLNAWENQPEILDFIRKNAFATLYTQAEGRPWATHLPALHLPVFLRRGSIYIHTYIHAYIHTHVYECI